ncbi:unnamed protein product, partial [Prorocentrum cordatum]
AGPSDDSTRGAPGLGLTDRKWPGCYVAHGEAPWILGLEDRTSPPRGWRVSCPTSPSTRRAGSSVSSTAPSGSVATSCPCRRGAAASVPPGGGCSLVPRAARTETRRRS